jgi:hypothetical protein
MTHSRATATLDQLADADTEAARGRVGPRWVIPEQPPLLVGCLGEGTDFRPCATACGPWLLWERVTSFTQSKPLPRGGLLRAFVELGRMDKPVSDKVIARFAARFGPLQLEPEQTINDAWWLPRARARALQQDRDPLVIEAKVAAGWHPSAHVHPTTPTFIPEPVGLWRGLTRQVGAILACAAAVRDGADPTDADADVTMRMLGSYHQWGCSFTPTGAGRMVVEAVNLWLRRGGVTQRVVVRPGAGREPRFPADYSFDLVSDNLLGQVAIELARAALGTDGVQVCEGCGETFTPKRRNSRYCDKPRCQHEKQALAARQYRARQRARRAASAESSSVRPGEG